MAGAATAQTTGVKKSVSFARWQQGAGLVVPRTTACLSCVQMNLTTSTNSVNLDSYSNNGEWVVLDSGAKRKEFSYAGLPGELFSNVAFSIHLRRRHLFYVINVIMPSLMTSVLLLSIFFCTPAQKVQIGVVVLLSFRIFLLNVADNIPKTSDHVPLLGQKQRFIPCSMVKVEI